MNKDEVLKLIEKKIDVYEKGIKQLTAFTPDIIRLAKLITFDFSLDLYTDSCYFNIKDKVDNEFIRRIQFEFGQQTLKYYETDSYKNYYFYLDGFCFNISDVLTEGCVQVEVQTALSDHEKECLEFKRTEINKQLETGIKISKKYICPNQEEPKDEPTNTSLIESTTVEDDLPF